MHRTRRCARDSPGAGPFPSRARDVDEEVLEADGFGLREFAAPRRIPDRDRLDLLEPGDMVFFGYNGDPDQIHHVGMYVGGGDFIHAPATGDVVRIVSLGGRIESRGDYVGAVRP